MKLKKSLSESLNSSSNEKSLIFATDSQTNDRNTFKGRASHFYNDTLRCETDFLKCLRWEPYQTGLFKN